MMNFARLMAVELSGGGGDVDIPKVEASSLIVNVLNAAYFIAGILAVGMIVFAGIQYITANGEPDKAKKAMNTIIFCVVGLIVIIAAYAITSFVVNQVGA